ncbi:MAG: flagellar motor protein MotB, partial [Planctomycetota bacterium]
MSSEAEESQQDIIVVRKYNVGDGGHHGGAWKIAYADFMTAMMALFLVLWLVNASDDETKAHVASYFNPVKLRDTVTGAKGLKKLKPGASKNVQGMQSKESRPGKGGDEGIGDAAMLRDPYEALDELAAKAKADAAQIDAVTDGVKLAAAGEGRTGGEAFKDPFDPTFWQDSLATSEDQRELEQAEAESPEADDTENLQESQLPQELKEAQKEKDDPATDETSDDSREDDPATKPAMFETVVVQGQVSPTAHEETAQNSQPGEEAHENPLDRPEADDEVASESPSEENARALKSDIDAAIADTNGAGPEIEVEKTKEGLLVRLTDNIDFEMFSIASASPSPQMVVFMEKIANVLASRSGQLVVMG